MMLRSAPGPAVLILLIPMVNTLRSSLSFRITGTAALAVDGWERTEGDARMSHASHALA